SFLMPLSFAYAVVKHRVLEIPMLLRLGLQYALARRVLVGLVPALAAILILDLWLHGDQPLVEVMQARGWVYAILGGLAVVAHTQREGWLRALDRRFFRERYDAQRLLREVVEDVRAARSFERVAPRVVARIEVALHPEFAALLVREPREPSYRSLAAAPAGQAPPPLPADSKLVALVRLLGKPLEVSLTETGWLKQQLPHAETDFLRQARIEWLLPVATALDRTEALLALGPKRSEEPYTREDQDLLVAVATSLALLLERPAPAPVPVSDAFEECPQCGTCYDTGAGRCAQEGATLNLVRVPRLLADRYRLERRLGRGGMGTVYAATDTALERRVAVKVIREELVGSADVAERFRREARAAAGFSHPNVVTVHDFGVAAGTRAFLVMELLEGTGLREELRRQKRLAASRTREILRGVCAAVEAAHRRPLIHRDLKPENIFLARAEAGETPKVLDFGVAKFLPTSTQPTADTGSSFLVGTLQYMAPEQLRGQAADAAWDLWALAIVAYEMLTGARPFPGATPVEWQSALLAGRFMPLATHLPDAPAPWQEFFERALALEPQRRPRSPRL
ncbi:MAG: serine/threonine-protein kinase, partial [Terriglobia bacterium]